jgi:hypothetical protein
MENKKSDLPLYNEEQGEQPDDRPKLDETVAAVRPPGQGSYYYDDSTGYEVYTPDDEGEKDEQSDDEPIRKRIRGQANRQTPY